MNTKNKHLTFEDRMEIQFGLKAKLKLIDIANKIGKDPRTVSFEIKRNLTKTINDRYLFTGTDKTNCQVHKSFPYVCDGCPLKPRCLSDFYHYDSKSAQKIYEKRLTNSRLGANLSINDLTLINTKLQEGLSLGQSIEHIASNNNFSVSVRTLYRYIENNNIDIKSYQLRVKPKLKLRKQKKQKDLDKKSFEGKRFIDFLEHIAKHPGTFSVQLDTVEGKRSDVKVLMTLIIIELHFFYAILLDRKSATCVKNAFDNLEKKLGLSMFRKMFPYILTDRGYEFIHHKHIEFSIDGLRRTRVYYCEPLASYQKGAIESYHRLLRYILPKGNSIDFLTPLRVDKINSNLNSYKLRSNQFMPAYDMALITFGKDVLDILKVRKIDPDFIHLTPKLVK